MSSCPKRTRKYLRLETQGQRQGDCQKGCPKEATVTKPTLLNKVCCDQAVDNSKQITHKPYNFVF